MPNRRFPNCRLVSLQAPASASSFVLTRARNSTFLARATFIWNTVLQWALPNHCGMCGGLSQDLICAACDSAHWGGVRGIRRCKQCALPLPILAESNRILDVPLPIVRCGRCLSAPPHFDATCVLGDYQAPLSQVVADLKFHAKLAYGREIGRRLAEQAAGLEETLDVILPVPLAPGRLAARGYNQAWLIARSLARCTGVPARACWLERSASTRVQTGLRRRERQRNVRGIFQLAGEARRGAIVGATVAVVDDVMTSGATLDAIARCLKKGGARRVVNLVALRTTPPS